MRIVSDVFTLADIWRRRQVRGQHFLKLAQVGGDDLQDEVDLAVQHVAFADFGDRRDMLLERGRSASAWLRSDTIAKTVIG